MTALGAFPVQADIGLTDQAWGTRVVMSCSYRGGKSGEYILVAVRRDGGTAELASWNAIPQDTAEVVVGQPSGERHQSVGGADEVWPHIAAAESLRPVGSTAATADPGE